MGTCSMMQKKKTQKTTQSGEITIMMAKVRGSVDIEYILNKKSNENKMYNPFKNPILNRRLRDTSPTKI